MAVAFSEIARVLDGARRREAWVVLATALAAGAAAALAFLLAGAALLAWGAPGASGAGPQGPIRWAALSLSALAVLTALAWAAVALVRRASSPEAVARTVGAAVPDLRGDLLSAVELEGEYPELARSGRYSLALVDAHVSRTAERTRGLDLARVVSARPARRSAAVLAAVVLAHALALVAAPRALAGGWRRLVEGADAEPVRRAEPITGDVELTYVYPAYMKRPPRTLSGTGGEISAPRGTEVTLRTRADRVLGSGEGAEIAIATTGEPSPATVAAPPPSAPSPSAAPASPPAGQRIQRLLVNDGRNLEGRLLVEEPGTYRFRFTKGRKLVAEGPALPITVEADAFPEVRITAPAQELEVDARARVRVEWTASDDVGLSELRLVTKAPHADERRTPLRRFQDARRESGSHDLDLGPLRLAEGEKLLYWLEVTDGDVVSGPKRGASTTHTIKIYSQAEHHRAAVAKVQALWEKLVALLGDRLELFDGDPPWTNERAARAQVLDGRTRELHEGLAEASRALRRDRAVPRELPAALANVASILRPMELELSALRAGLARALRLQGKAYPQQVARVADLDRRLDRELERDVLYLEQLLDRQRAEDLVQVAKDLAARRRELAGLLEKYRQSPTEQGKQELLAEVARLKDRMQEMMRRMAELAKGLSDEHMNREALAELAKSRDAMGGLDEVEKKLAQGDVEGAMKALDQLGNALQEMQASLERTAGTPGRQNAELMKEMLAFKKQLEEVQAAQEQVARETEAVKAEYQKRLAERMSKLDATAKRLQGLAAEARRELDKAEKGVSLRSEDDFAQGRDRLADVERALQARDFDAALETARRALPPMQRLAMGLEDDATVAERYRALGVNREPRELREAQRHAVGALGPARQVKDELERLFPDPRSVLGQKDQGKLGELEGRQGELERRAGALRQKLAELAQKAPVFPPQAGEALGGSQGHMLRAQGELGQKNAQRGHAEQRQALDELARFKRGLDEMAKKGGGQGGGFPFPFGEEQGGREGEGLDPSQEKVEIPGAEAYKAPDEFRKDLLEAMKQGTPESYKGEVQRYYEELVK